MVRTRVRRLPRHLYTGERSVAFTACTKDREVLFLQPKDIDAHVDNLRRAADACDCVVPIYCFMPDHLHVMFKGLDATSDTLAAMVKFKLLSGLWFRRKGLPGWQADFWDHAIRGRVDWRAHATYIAHNPVRAGLVEDPFEYPLLGSIGCDLSDVILGW
jgi:REP element-mobilizing transposase RayT